LGIVVGSVLDAGLTIMYTRFYRFPVFGFQWNTAVVASALLISSAAAVAGRGPVRTPSACRRRGDAAGAAGRVSPTLIDRSGLGEFLPQAARMILRELERRPFKAALSCLGIFAGDRHLDPRQFHARLDQLHHRLQFRLSQRQD